MIPTQVLDSLESRYEPIKVKDLINRNAEYHILILGGGHGFDDRLPSNSLLSQNALGRLNEAIRLHQQLPNSVLIFSGYSASGKTTQAEMLLQTALSLGIVEKETMLQKDPVNTYEEAEVYSTKYGNTSPIILVTNAAHMPRAVNSFNNFGLDPLASPTNYRLKGSWRHKWFGLPSMRNIENLKVGIYEYAALFWYSL
ncbi:YdcF family protein [Fodinibius saliphilus]|uniref:YdcF family protein n=1 Tax=Fodinibius saliphilus TaxID=1920650 RepID=UPI001486C7FC|nr:ElyC/SanA/YdcF family protein [Fodinibius saliphilus]